MGTLKGLRMCPWLPVPAIGLVLVAFSGGNRIGICQGSLCRRLDLCRPSQHSIKMRSLLLTMASASLRYEQPRIKDRQGVPSIRRCVFHDQNACRLRILSSSIQPATPNLVVLDLLIRHMTGNPLFKRERIPYYQETLPNPCAIRTASPLGVSKPCVWKTGAATSLGPLRHRREKRPAV